MRPDDETQAELTGLLDRFCDAFARRDADAVLELFAPDPDVVVITSEEALLRGHEELTAFLHRYARGDTTYSWEWDRHDASAAGEAAWLLAEGFETAAGPAGEARHPYRMTMVFERREGRWLLMQAHGSSPHEG